MLIDEVRKEFPLWVNRTIVHSRELLHLPKHLVPITITVGTTLRQTDQNLTCPGSSQQTLPGQDFLEKD